MAVQVDPPCLPRNQGDPYSDCVWAQIEALLVNQSAARIVVTMSLGTAEVVPWGFGGKVRVGLICAKLRLLAKGGEIPHEDRWPEHKVETTTPVQGTDERRRKQGRSLKSDAKVEASAASLKGEAKTEAGGSTEEEETARRSFSFDEWTIRSGGSETSAYWEFRAKKPEEEVHLRLVSHEVGRFLVKEDEALITCGIEFMDTDLRILKSQGVLAGWAGSDHVSKRPFVLGIIRKMLAEDLRKRVSPPPQCGAT